MHKIAVVKEKSTGHRFEVYQVTGDSGSAYAVWARNGYACRCHCKSRQFRTDKRRKHMLKLQAELDEQRATAPLYRQTFDVLR